MRGWGEYDLSPPPLQTPPSLLTPSPLFSPSLLLDPLSSLNPSPSPSSFLELSHPNSSPLGGPALVEIATARSFLYQP